MRGIINYANVMATLALFVALGGASYAVVALPADSVGVRQIRPGAVTRRALAFPTGAASRTDASSIELRGNFCNGWPLSPGQPAPPCPARPKGGRTPGREVALTLNAPGLLVVLATVGVTNQGIPNTRRSRSKRLSTAARSPNARWLFKAATLLRRPLKARSHSRPASMLSGSGLRRDIRLAAPTFSSGQPHSRLWRSLVHRSRALTAALLRNAGWWRVRSCETRLALFKADCDSASGCAARIAWAHGCAATINSELPRHAPAEGSRAASYDPCRPP